MSLVLRSKDQVWTPDEVASHVLSDSGWPGHKKWKESKILEPSFGEGVFLWNIIKTIITFAKVEGWSKEKVGRFIDDNVYGVELDSELYDKTVHELIDKTRSFSGVNVTLPNLVNEDFLDYESGVEFDFIVGNPPYLRVHDLIESTRAKVKSVTPDGKVVDLYVAFVEKSFSLLKSSGVMSFIVPNSWMMNVSLKSFRERYVSSGHVYKLTDYQDVNVFEGKSVFTVILSLAREQRDSFPYVALDEFNSVKFQRYVSTQDYKGGVPLVVSGETRVEANVFSFYTEGMSLGDVCLIKNAALTLGNKFFLTDSHSEGEFVRRACKHASLTSEGNTTERIVFPYKSDADELTPVDFSELPDGVQSHLIANKDGLVNRRSRDAHGEWYHYGRKQSLGVMGERKLVVPTIVHPSKCVVSHIVDSDVIVYADLIVVQTEDDWPLEKIQSIIGGDDFRQYVALFGKRKQNGYREISSSLIKQFSVQRLIDFGWSFQ